MLVCINQVPGHPYAIQLVCRTSKALRHFSCLLKAYYGLQPSLELSPLSPQTCSQFPFSKCSQQDNFQFYSKLSLNMWSTKLDTVRGDSWIYLSELLYIISINALRRCCPEILNSIPVGLFTFTIFLNLTIIRKGIAAIIIADIYFAIFLWGLTLILLSRYIG